MDTVNEVLIQARTLPDDWPHTSPAMISKRLRHRFEMTQRQLAAFSGLPHSKVAKIEGGQDVRVSTLVQLFAGFGCGLAFLPVSPLSADRLWHRTHNISFECGVPRHRRFSRK
ncbi:MAG: helix-turn-helix transcriptional regulator [Elusimicrobiota bacterium]